MKRLLLVLAILCTGYTAVAQTPCATIQYRDTDYTICSARPGPDDIRLFLKDGSGNAYGRFSPLAKALTGEKTLLFAMNAGMYHANRDPVGLYVENGRELQRINLRNGPGNFHMRPNGVFYITGNIAGVMEAERFAASGIKPVFATQSGPMLVIDGKIHPKILPGGTSSKLRNGVGINRNGTVHFVISNQPVTFYAFASLFRDRLNCANALFFDGTVSALYVPGLGRTADPIIPLGPIVGVISRGK